MPDALAQNGSTDTLAAGDACWQQLARRSLTAAQAGFYNTVCRQRQPMRIDLHDPEVPDDAADQAAAADAADADSDQQADDRAEDGPSIETAGALEDDVDPAACSLTASFCWQPQGLDGPVRVAQVETSHGPLDLYLADDLVDALLDRRYGTSSFARMDQSSEQVIVEYALAPLIAALSPGQVMACTIGRAADDGETGSARAFRVDVVCQWDDDETGMARIATDDPAVAEALQRKVASHGLATQDNATLTAPLIIHAGRTRMRRRDLDSLAVTDVILVDHSALEDAKAVLRVPGSPIAYFAEVGQYSLTTLERVNGPVEGLDQPTEDEMTELEETGDIEVDVVFEIGRLDISLEELASLGPGHVFTLGRPLDIAVTIRANNARIGSGDIVFVDDRVGVQISKLKNADKPSDP